MAIDIENLGTKLGTKHASHDFIKMIEEALDAEENHSGMGIAFLHGMLCMAKMCREMTLATLSVNSEENQK